MLANNYAVRNKQERLRSDQFSECLGVRYHCRHQLVREQQCPCGNQAGIKMVVARYHGCLDACPDKQYGNKIDNRELTEAPSADDAESSDQKYIDCERVPCPRPQVF